VSGVIEPSAAIGFIGLGNMGWPVAARLAAAGYRLHVADLNEDAVRRFAAEHGAASPPSLEALGRAADAVITILPDGGTVRGVLLGERGVTAGLSAKTIVIDMSSSNPVGTRELGVELARRRISLIDAPVSGGVRRALDGSLSIMVGGEPEAIARARPLLEAVARQVFLTGPLGTGHAMKALNNMVSAAGLWIAVEALRVGESFGLHPGTMVDILNASTGRNNSTEVKFKQFILSRSFASGFSLGLMAKDLRIAADVATTTGLPSPLMQDCCKLWSQAAQALGGAEDHTAVVKFLERMAASDDRSAGL
jgi:3-hydroxyisobutyrate dehydrogenase